MATWEHPDLGRFKFVVDRWEQEMKVPEFDAFSFEPSHDAEGNLDNRFELHFHAETDEEPPSDAAVAIARKVLSDPVRIISAALWEDFNGRGPGSHMWWHENMEMLAEASSGHNVRQEKSWWIGWP